MRVCVPAKLKREKEKKRVKKARRVRKNVPTSIHIAGHFTAAAVVVVAVLVVGTVRLQTVRGARTGQFVAAGVAIGRVSGEETIA